MVHGLSKMGFFSITKSQLIRHINHFYSVTPYVLEFAVYVIYSPLHFAECSDFFLLIKPQPQFKFSFHVVGLPTFAWWQEAMWIPLLPKALHMTNVAVIEPQPDSYWQYIS